MSVSVSMPQLGESVTEGTVTRWLKKEGERVEADEPLLEVSTDKVDTEIPSPVAGILRGITVAEDETVAVGAELAVIDETGAEAAAPAAGDGADGQAEPAAAAESPDGYQAGARSRTSSPRTRPRPRRGTPTRPRAARRVPGRRGARGRVPAAGRVRSPPHRRPATRSRRRPPGPPRRRRTWAADRPQAHRRERADIWQRTQPATPAAPPPAPPAPPAPRRHPRPGSGTAGSRAAGPAARPPAGGGAARAASPLGTADGPYVTPLVRKLAAEHGVDLATVAGTGVGGRIRKQDVVDAARVRREAIAAAQQSAAADGQPAAGPAAWRRRPRAAVPARDRAVPPARHDRADVAGPAAHRPPHGRVPADVSAADHRGRGGRHRDRQAPGPRQGRLRGPRGGQAHLPPVLRAGRGGGAEGAPAAQRQHRAGRERRSPTTTRSISASRWTPSGG